MPHISGFADYFKLGFTSGTLVKIGYGLAVILSVLFLFTGYKFMTATEADQIFWGVFLILNFNAQVAVKLWIFSQKKFV